jgi:hypothetical protein
MSQRRTIKKNRTNRIHEKPSIAEATVDLTAVFRRAGLPHKVLASARFAARHRFTGTAGESTEHYTLTWMVRCTLTECLPARRFRTSRGELILIEYPGFPDGNGQDKPVVIAALRPAAGLIELLLPEEIGHLL